MHFSFGIDCLLRDNELQRALNGRRVALLGHPASVTMELGHSVDALMQTPIKLTALLGPQHGIRGEKQDNMVESADEVDPTYKLPVFSLYGQNRRLTEEMAQRFDVLLVDLQDVGCRVYTYITTLFYLIEDCAKFKKELWVLDRPNPAGRPVEGLALLAGNESFVGAAQIPMRHGLTMGEAASWYRHHNGFDVELNIVVMRDYDPVMGPGHGWPGELPWVNPSPNLATLNAARVYSGTVLLEGTTLSEGRGTTRPLECVGAPDLSIGQILPLMRQLAPEWLQGCCLRPCYFEPMFHKHKGTRCAGMQIHTDCSWYRHELFKPFRLVALFLKALRTVHPDYTVWRDFAYEYETGRLPIDIINGGSTLRQWVDDSSAAAADLEKLLLQDEAEWRGASSTYYLYGTS